MVDLLAQIERHRVIAIVRGNDPQAVYDVCQTLLTAGLKLIEVPLTTPDACDVISRLRQAAPEDAIVGAGTVLTPTDVEQVQAAGAQFVVTPAITGSVQASIEGSMPVICGAYTGTEIYKAFSLGVTAVKLFPASAGGPKYLKAIRDPFPNVPMVAVGGVDSSDIPGYIAAGALGVGVGGPLIGDALNSGDLDALTQRAKRFLDVVA